MSKQSSNHNEQTSNNNTDSIEMLARLEAIVLALRALPSETVQFIGQTDTAINLLNALNSVELDDEKQQNRSPSPK